MDNPVPQPHSTACFLIPLIVPTVLGWVCWEADSEKKLGVQQLYSGVTPVVGGKGMKQDLVVEGFRQRYTPENKAQQGAPD